MKIKEVIKACQGEKLTLEQSKKAMNFWKARIFTDEQIKNIHYFWKHGYRKYNDKFSRPCFNL